MRDVLRQSESALRIKEFMRRAGQTIPDRPTIPDEKTRILRAKLILEEALETITALGVRVRAKEGSDFVDLTFPYPDAGCQLTFGISGEPNLTEIADGCCDVKVVTDGTLIACGIAGEAVQELVDQSNLAKFETPKCPDCGGEMELQDTTIILSNRQGRERHEWVCQAGGLTHQQLPKEAGPYTREDGKHIKPPYWKKPDIEGLLKAQTEAVEGRCRINDPANRAATEEMLNKNVGSFPGPYTFGESVTDPS